METQLEKDKEALKVARQELDWKQSECDRLERAVDYGRCKKCNEPLMFDEKEHCGDYPECFLFLQLNVGSRFKVCVSEILCIAKRQREINSKELTEIDFLDENENTINVDKKIIKDFRFSGLNNTDFITSQFYLKGLD